MNCLHMDFNLLISNCHTHNLDEITTVSYSDKFYFSDSKGIFMLLFMVLGFLLMVPSKMADNMFKLKIYPNLGMFGILSNLANHFL